MEEKYWKQFAASGKVTDYLNYRGMAICEEVMRKHGRLSEAGTGEIKGESDNRDGDGAVGRPDWRI